MGRDEKHIVAVIVGCRKNFVLSRLISPVLACTLDIQ